MTTSAGFIFPETENGYSVENVKMTVKKALEYIKAGQNTQTTINPQKVLPKIEYSKNKIDLTFNYLINEPSTTNPTPHINPLKEASEESHPYVEAGAGSKNTGQRNDCEAVRNHLLCGAGGIRTHVQTRKMMAFYMLS